MSLVILMLDIFSTVFNSDGLIGILAALFGGVGVRVADKVLSKKSENWSEGVQIRTELRADLSATKNELTTVKTELNHCMDENDIWENEYRKLVNKIRENNPDALKNITLFVE